MKRFLVVVDGSVPSALALEQALESARALPGSEIVLLNIPPQALPWQQRRPAPHFRRDVADRVMALALARAKSAGVLARAVVEPGEKADVVARIAQAQGCDHIFLPEDERTPVSRVLLALTGLGAKTVASRIHSLSDLPVTVVAHARRSENV